VQLVATVERLFSVPAGAFRPRPRVNSAVVRLVPRGVPLVASEAEELRVRGLIQALFQRRRQQLRRSLREAFQVAAPEAEALLERLGIEPEARPEVLGPERFVALARALAPCLAS
jgi:16S rRNA (adenine1518-N6/adenine1519-N6)-dimethyltransferase